MSDAKEFSVSSNGDRWFLETIEGDMVVRHQANEPSGGHKTRIALATFLKESSGKPEHAALLQVLGQSENEIDDQLESDDTETPSLKIATEYLRLGGKRYAKIDDNIVSTRAYEDDPSEAEAYWQRNVASLAEKEQRDIVVHLPSMNDR